MGQVAELDFTELDAFGKNLYKMLWQHPKEAKRFMNKAGSNLRKVVKKQYTTLTKKHTGNLLRGISKGKSFEYKPYSAFSVRVYNTAPHAHLIEYGYTRGKALHEIKGKFVLDKAEKIYEANFVKQADMYIDKLLERGFA